MKVVLFKITLTENCRIYSIYLLLKLTNNLILSTFYSYLTFCGTGSKYKKVENIFCWVLVMYFNMAFKDFTYYRCLLYKGKTVFCHHYFEYFLEIFSIPWINSKYLDWWTVSFSSKLVSEVISLKNIFKLVFSMYTAPKKSFFACLCMELNYPKYRWCGRGRGRPLSL